MRSVPADGVHVLFHRHDLMFYSLSPAVFVTVLLCFLVPPAFATTPSFSPTAAEYDHLLCPAEHQALWTGGIGLWSDRDGWLGPRRRVPGMDDWTQVDGSVEQDQNKGAETEVVVNQASSTGGLLLSNVGRLVFTECEFYHQSITPIIIIHLFSFFFLLSLSLLSLSFFPRA